MIIHDHHPELSIPVEHAKARRFLYTPHCGTFKYNLWWHFNKRKGYILVIEMFVLSDEWWFLLVHPSYSSRCSTEHCMCTLLNRGLVVLLHTPHISIYLPVWSDGNLYLQASSLLIYSLPVHLTQRTYLETGIRKEGFDGGVCVCIILMIPNIFWGWCMCGQSWVCRYHLG